MSKMGTSFRKGRKRRRVLLLSLLLTVVVAIAAALPAAASYGSFDITVNGNGHNDGKVTCSTAETRNLYTDKIFVAENRWYFSSVRAIRITSTDIRTDSPVQIDVDRSEGKSNWIVDRGDTETVLTYRSDWVLTPSDFNTLMAKVNVYFNQNSDKKNGSAKISIKAYNSSKSFVDSGWNQTLITYPQAAYTCNFTFYGFAEGEVDQNSAKVDYKAEYASGYDSTYEQDVPDATDNDINIVPKDLSGGKATFDLYITDTGSGSGSYGYLANVGYQVKKSSEPWTNKVESVFDKDNDIQLRSWNPREPIPITVEGLDAGVSYEIRGVIATDGKYSTPKTTESISVRYEKPNINTFNIGSTATYYKGGEDSMTLSMLSTFNDTNAVNQSYTGSDGRPHTGPALHADVYFTADRNFTETKDSDGNVTATKDNSKWYRVAVFGAGKELQDSQGTVATTFEKTWAPYKLPERMSDIGAAPDSEDKAINPYIDSTKCAFKLVITDLYTGYSTYTYSDTFTVDSSAPDNLSVTARDAKGGNIPLDLDSASMVGGKGSKVDVYIGGAQDGEGSQIKAYSYSMYYLSTDDVTPDMGSTRKEILQTMSGFNSDDYKGTYTAWTTAGDALDKDGNVIENMTQLSVSKDGYYRIDAKAVDNAGRESGIIEAYFRVDLTAPSTPEVRLVKQPADTTVTKDDVSALKPYDNRTYTDSTVWLFAYSKPKTGKVLDTFEYSTDGGLTWKDVANAQTANQIIDFGNGDLDFAAAKKVSAYPKGEYVNPSSFQYQIGINLSGEGENDYTSVLVKARDTLGNESLTSEAVVMRTIADTPQPSSVLQHEGIEVALAMGNTTMKTSALTGDLKNASAQKINAKFYGTSGSGNAADWGKDNFNPYLYVLNYVSGGHKCTWSNTQTCAGACKDGENCPYYKLQKGLDSNHRDTYEIYTPQMVNVQGMSGADPNSGNLKWTRYDHTFYRNFATAGFTGASNPGWSTVRSNANKYVEGSSSPLIKPVTTSIAGLADQQYYDAKTGLYTGTKDRVIWMGQNKTASYNSSTGKWTIPDNTTIDMTESGTAQNNSKAGYSYMDAYNTAYSGSLVSTAFHSSQFPGDYDDTTLKKTGYWSIAKTGSGIYYTGQQTWRIYHMIDISVYGGKDTTSDATYNYTYYDQSDPSKLTMSSIASAGYFRGAMRDWLFMYNDQPAKKQILFTVDDATACAHANDGYGFMFNTTIRQSSGKNGSDGSWRISGYMFYIGNANTERFSHDNNSKDQYTSGSERLEGYKYYVLKIDDVNMEHFSDGTIRGAAGVGYAGYGKSGAKLGASRHLEDGNGDQGSGLNGGGSWHDDILKYVCYQPGKQKAGVNGNDWAGDSTTAQGPKAMPNSDGIDYGIRLLGVSDVDVATESGTKNLWVRNFALVTEGNYTYAYLFNTGRAGDAGTHWSADDLKKQLAKDVTEENPNGAGSYTTGYKAIKWSEIDASAQIKGVGENTLLKTPRPYVDGYQIGTLDAKAAKVHRDTNCYGFGPFTSARSYSHACYADTRVIISNITMTVNVMRKLSEVVNEPQWGGGKAKYIVNLADDSVDDFNDPILSAQVQWRLFNDSAKFVGWGSADNKEQTVQFLDRIDGDGTFQINDITLEDDVTQQKTKMNAQVQKVAEYITTEYYKAFGFDVEKDTTPVVNQVSKKAEKPDGINAPSKVYSLKDMKNISFHVTPEKYNTSTANPDFPAGRWYIVHDITGYGAQTEPFARSGKYSDALDLKITEPGRYTIYFAPDTEAVRNNRLDPRDKSCVFDFVVNTPAVAQFSGTVDNSGKISITDSSYDPDTGVSADKVKPNGKDISYEYTPYSSDGSARPVTTKYNDIQLGGIKNTYWRWEILFKGEDKYGDQILTTLATSGDWDNTLVLNGNTVAGITKGKLTKEGRDHADAQNKTNAATAYFKNVPDGAVLTVYEKVEDVSTYRKAIYTDTSNPTTFKGYEYKYAQVNTTGATEEKRALTESEVCQQNLTADSDVTYAPLSVMSPSSVNMYDTADDSGTTGKIIVERQSKQTQKRTDYVPSWAIDFGDNLKYRKLVKKTGTNDYYLYPEASYKDAQDYPDEPTKAIPEQASSMPSGSVLALKCTVAPGVKTQGDADSGKYKDLELGEAYGSWEISKDFIATQLKSPGVPGDEKSFALQITETIEGKPTSVSKIQKITNSSARAVFYWKDTAAPTAQAIVSTTMVLKDGEWKSQTYEASNYLDVTNGDKYVNIHVSGSKDNEGKVAGYGYYFYDVKLNSKVSDIDHETKYYYMDGSGLLKPAANAKDAVSKQVKKLGPEGGDIKITNAVMEGLTTPTHSVNVAVFAYDNQDYTKYGETSPGLTNGNESQKTRVEDIKLSKSRPMPPEISVTNALNLNVADIKNDAGYNGYTGDPDKQTSALNGFSNTNVTVQFLPRKAKFSMDDKTNELKPDSNGTEYYEDVYKRADLTGIADVKYTIRYRKDLLNPYEICILDGKEQKDITIPSARNITLSENGIYEVTGAIVNGAGTVSEIRTVTFTIDKQKPTPMTVDFNVVGTGEKYIGGTWAKGVEMTVSNSTDTYGTESQYWYTKDNGKNWVSMGEGLSKKTYTFTETGEYDVTVKAVDPAGNECLYERLTAVKIDALAPNTVGPTLEASSVTTPLYAEYIISLNYDSHSGKILSLQDDVLNERDTEVSVPAGKDVRFYFYPSEGKKLGTVTFGGNLVTDADLQFDNSRGAYYFEVQGVNADATLAAVFPGDEVNTMSYMAKARSVASMRFSAPAAPASEEPSTSEGEVTPAEIPTAEPATESSQTPSDSPSSEPSGTPSASPAPSTSPEPGGNGETPSEPDIVTYEVSAKAGSGGEVSLDATEVAENGFAVCTITPAAGYAVSEVYVNGVSVSLDNLIKQDTNPVSYAYSIGPITQKTAITVQFKEVESRLLKLSVTGNGKALISSDSVVENQGNNQYSVPVGSNVTVEMKPDSDQYMVKSLVVDGVEVEEMKNNVSNPSYHTFSMPAYTEETGKDEGVEVSVVFDVATDVKYYSFDVSVNTSSDGQTHGGITPSGSEVKIPRTGSQTFVITPEQGYKVPYVWITQDQGDGPVRLKYSEFTNLEGNKKAFTLAPSSDGVIEVEFEINTYALITEPGQGGDIALDRVDGLGFNKNAIPEGTSMIITPKPKPGYKIKNLIVIYDNIKTDLGAVSSYVLENMHAEVTVQAVFEMREVNRNKTTHMITAVANNIKDDNDKLADEPYCFQISDGTNTSGWSNWSASNTISYTGILPEGATEEIPLDPNKEYTVYVRARDRVNNISDPVSSTIYTLANMPGTLGAEAVNTPGEETSKSVALFVDSNGNPSWTEYCVYYSNSPDMADMQVANENESGGEWATLQDGQFIIRGLTPGIKYYLQVVARNNNHHSTALNNNDIASIRLSPAAPPANSFYFEDQASPIAPVVLRWEAPSGGDVESIEIYRDGMFIAQKPVTDLKYEDPAHNFTGDHIGVYSYSFVNTAGAGSSRTAVSREYHDALRNAESDEAAHAKLDKMDNLVASTGYDLFSETMTYPRFPLKVERYSASADSTDTKSGRIKVYVDRDTTEVDRWQKYYLTLKAFKQVPDENGNPIYEEVTDPSKWDSKGINQEPKETKVIDPLGPSATWTDLDIQYEYRVYVQEIRSTGPKVANDGYGGQSQGIEGNLGKTYIVDKTGYRIEYSSSKANESPALQVSSGTWTDTELQQFTGEAGWDRPLNAGYIAFNKSPYIELADTANIYTGNDPDKIQEDADGQYILIDQSMEDMTFTINAAAWDKDGTPKDKLPLAYVKGEIAGIKGDAGKLSAQMPTSETAAKDPNNLYAVEFDARGLTTGVYTDLTLNVFDGDTESTVNAQVRVVVNRTSPTAYVEGGMSTRKLQKGSAYAKDSLKIVPAIPEESNVDAQNKLNEVGLIIMPKVYEQSLGSSNIDVLTGWLCTQASKNETALKQAKDLLGKDADNALYVNPDTGLLTPEGLTKAIAKVKPPVRGYVQITKEQYDALYADEATKNLVRKEENATVSYYWVEGEYALEHPEKALCTWLESQSDGSVLVTGEEGKEYSIELVTSFGGNTFPMVLTFAVKPSPSVTIKSRQSWGWKESFKEEYATFQEMTVGEVIEQYKGCYTGEPDLGATKLTDPAAKLGETGEMLVYKLTDECASISYDWIAGKVLVERGIYNQFDEVGVYFAPVRRDDSGQPLPTEQQFDPNRDPVDSTITVGTVTDSLGHPELTENGEYSFSVNGLAKGTTYYLWTYYTVRDPVTNELRDRVYSKDYVALTTSKSYPLTYYGFEKAKYSYAEKDYYDPGDMNFKIVKQGSAGTSAKITVTAEYYAADEFGNLLYEDDGSGVLVPKKIMEPQLSWAKETLQFFDGGERFVINATPDLYEIRVRMTLTDTLKEQGHMIVRLRLAISDPDGGYSYPLPDSDYTDIFVQDNESPMQSFKLGVRNEDKNGKPLMDEVMDKTDSTKLLNYYYQFPGLPVDYINGRGSLNIPYWNNGTGNLENITAAVYKDREGTQPSDDFLIQPMPNHTSLPKSMEGLEGTFGIMPALNLKDGVYEGWVFLTADNMDKNDIIKIHVCQVVGQSTLSGRIYIGPEMPVSDLERTGVATVSLYDISTTSTNGVFSNEPLYTTQTSEYGGYFTIPNIINKGSYYKGKYCEGSYYIVVERDGFVTYDSPRFQEKTLITDNVSRTYTFDLRLRGGDVNRSQTVDDDDLSTFVQYYNRYYQLGTEATTEDERMVRRCDFNQDGAVNALDRAFLIGNLGSGPANYAYTPVKRSE